LAEAEVCLGEGGLVIDAIPGHRDHCVRALKALDLGHLVFRVDLGGGPVDADLGRDPLDDAAAVAEQQPWSQAERTRFAVGPA